jgi:hypothetical protein
MAQNCDGYGADVEAAGEAAGASALDELANVRTNFSPISASRINR